MTPYRVRAAWRVAAALLTAVASAATWSQSSQQLDPSLLLNLPPEQRQQLIDRYLERNKTKADQDAQLMQPETVQPAPVAPAQQPKAGAGSTPARAGNLLPSLEEQAREAGIQPYGYGLFAGVPSTFAPATDIPVPVGYVLGPGDVLHVQLYGKDNESYSLVISRDGTVNFPKLGPIALAGMRFQAASDLLTDRVHKELIGVDASITLGRLRSMRVFLLGDASRPGAYTVSALSTITNALFVAGGVREGGSLRRIEVKRQGKTVHALDLYDVLLRGDARADVRLQPQDALFIPPVGGRVTIFGQVNRPAVYELKDAASVKEVVALAGGLTPQALAGTALLERIDARGKRVLRQLSLSSETDLAAPVQDGDLLKILELSDRVEDQVAVVGYVRYPSAFQWREGMTAADALGAAQVLPTRAGEELYLGLGLIERTDAGSGLRQFSTFDLRGILSGKTTGPALQADDLILVFKRSDIEFLSSRAVREVLAGREETRSLARSKEVKEEVRRQEKEGSAVQAEPLETQLQARRAADVAHGCPALYQLLVVVKQQRALRFAHAFAAAGAGTESAEPGQDLSCPAIFEKAPRALPYLFDRAIALVGEVQRPGIYPVEDGVALGEATRLAGGLTAEGDPRRLEFVSYRDALGQTKVGYQTLDLGNAETAGMALTAGDIVAARPYYLGQQPGTVALRGEVRFPGTYGILRGEKLSQLLQRAGGFTDDAYPYGAVFTRESAKRAESDANRRAARDLRDAIATAVTKGNFDKQPADVAAVLNEVIQQLEAAPAVGRIVAQVNPALFAEHPDADIAVEPGDDLYVPRRPTSVTVIGQVLNPGAVLHKTNASAKDYLRQVGGLTKAADDDRVFVVYPDGTAKTLDLSFWSIDTAEVPTGSVIVIPRDAAPLNTLALTERVTSILANLSLSAAALVTVSNQ